MAAGTMEQGEAQALIERYIHVDGFGRGPADARLTEYGTPVWALVGYYFGDAGRDLQRVAEDYEIPIDAARAALAYYHEHRPALDARLTLNAA